MTELARSGQRQSAEAQISTGAVQIVLKHTGRGPTKAKTTITDEMAVILMADTLTQGERTLAESGRDELVLGTRTEFQRVMREDLVALVEQHTKRKVTAFMSDNHIGPDYGAEVFVLEPQAA